MTIKQILRSDDIQRVESEIIDVLNGTGIRYRNADSLQPNERNVREYLLIVCLTLRAWQASQSQKNYW